MTDPMLQMLRRDEADLFDSTCRITVKGAGEGSTDADGNYHPPEPTVVYEGPCMFTSTGSTRTVEAAGQVVEIYPFKITVPANTPVKRGHVVEITACPDEAAVGEFYVVRSAPPTQWQVNRALGVEQGVE